MWCLVVFQHDFHSQCLPQVKEKLLLNNIRCLDQRKKLFAFASTQTESHETNTTAQ